VSDSVQRSDPVGREALPSYLQQFDSHDFELFVADLWSRQGWETEVTPPSQDGGVDIVATRQFPVRLKVVIQAKRYSPARNVSSTEIQQYGSLHRQEENVDAVAVVTTSEFTEQAQRTAGALNVKLVDADDLCETIARVDGHDLLNTYLDDDVITNEVVTSDEFVADVPLGDGTRSALQDHLLEGYGLNDTNPVDQYIDGETVFLVHSSSDNPVQELEGETNTFDVETDSDGDSEPVHLHLTSEGVRIFIRNTDGDDSYFFDYDDVNGVRSDSALFGPSESVTFTLGDGGHVKYKFDLMSSDIRRQFEKTVAEMTGESISL